MKKYTDFTARLRRATQVGATLGVTIFAASALQAQYAGQGPTTPEIPYTGTVANVPHQAKEFLDYSAQVNQTQIAMADLAQAKAQSPSVKQLAQTLRMDREQNDAQLQAIAQNHGVVLAPALDRVDERALNSLGRTSQANFDQEYTKAAIREDVKSIERFDKVAAQGGNSDMMQYARSTLPVLRHDLRLAKDSARAAGVDEPTIASLVRGLSANEALTVR